MRGQIIITAALCILASAALAQDATTNRTSAGETYMQKPAGMALYVFDQDRTPGSAPGPSTCYDQCAKLWPPFNAGSADQPHEDWTLQDRKAGGKQWAYKGRPLYTFVRDTAPGKVDGNGFNGNRWHLAEP